jgi:choline dehydrogenase-like flavoprotein
MKGSAINHSDVLIIGGASGAVAAKRLAEPGLYVMCLKAFPPTSPRDFSTISSGDDVPTPDGQSDKKVDPVSIDLLIATNSKELRACHLLTTTASSIT